MTWPFLGKQTNNAGHSYRWDTKRLIVVYYFHAGNNWGCENGVCGLGYGPQEQIRGCADVTIINDGVASSDDDTSTTTTTTTTTTTAPTTTTTQNSGGSGTCHSAGAYAGDTAVDAWCVTNCAAGNCPATHCACDWFILTPRIWTKTAENLTDNFHWEKIYFV